MSASGNYIASSGGSVVATLTPELKAKLRATLQDPVLFAHKHLGVELWTKQQEIVRAVRQYQRTAVKACHASGKTFTAAVILLGFLAGYTEIIIITSAPTWKQVEKLLWGEVHSLLERCKFPFPPALNTEIHIGPKRYAYGMSTNVTKQDEGANFQGFHAANVLVILDEAPGIDAKIWEAVEGILSAGRTHLLAIGNPTIPQGPFYDAFGKDRKLWHTDTISAFDTPNLQGITLQQLLAMDDADPRLDENPVPYLVSRRWVRTMIKKWGMEHPFVQSRVFGNFPKQSADCLYGLAQLEGARRLLGDSNDDDLITFGVDVAGPGEDETVMAARCRNDILGLWPWPQADPRGEIVAKLKEFPRHRVGTVNVDAVGIGYYIARHIQDFGFTVADVNVGEASSDPEKYKNLKAELYWGFKMRLDDGHVGGLEDDTALGQLAGIHYGHNSRGQIEIESKEDAKKKRGMDSPDRAEAIILAYGAPSAIENWARCA